MSLPGDSTVLASMLITVDRQPDGVITAQCQSGVYGMEDTNRTYRASEQVPEECAAFYDDVTHLVRLLARDMCECVLDVSTPVGTPF